jgi:hypothetical protein
MHLHHYAQQSERPKLSQFDLAVITDTNKKKKLRTNGLMHHKIMLLQVCKTPGKYRN